MNIKVLIKQSAIKMAIEKLNNILKTIPTMKATTLKPPSLPRPNSNIKPLPMPTPPKILPTYNPITINQNDLFYPILFNGKALK